MGKEVALVEEGGGSGWGRRWLWLRKEVPCVFNSMLSIRLALVYLTMNPCY